MVTYVSPRRKLNSNVVAFPATKSAGALTISSDEIYDFEQTAYGAAVIQLVAADASKITDTLTVAPFVSFDKGVTWKQAANYADLANGVGTISVIKSLNYAPRIKVEAVFDGTGALAAGHGCNVYVQTNEYESNYERAFYGDVTAVPATQVAGANTYYGVSKELPATVGTSQLTALVQVADLSKVTDNFTYQMQSSYDGVYWWDLWSTAKTDIANGAGILYVEHDMDSGAVIGNYARINLIGDGTSALAATHGINFDLLAFSR